ncbi:MAG: DinB family protein [Bacteroidia bacterium]
MIEKPVKGEYPEFYHTYVSKVPDGKSVIDFLKTQMEELVNLFSGIEDGEAEKAYAEGKWTIKELLCHIIDAERIFAYRALSFARQDKTTLPGFEEDDYAKYSNANERELTNLVEEFYHVRKSNIALFSSFNAETSKITGNANGKSISVRAIIYSIAGHAEHHKQVLKERYLKK